MQVVNYIAWRKYSSITKTPEMVNAKKKKNAQGTLNIYLRNTIFQIFKGHVSH